MARDFAAGGISGHYVADTPDYTGRITVACWVKPRTVGSRIWFGNDGVWVLDQGNPLHMYNWSVGDVLTSGGVISTGVAHSLIADIYGGSSRIFIDGVQTATFDAGGFGTNILQLGGRNGQPTDGPGCEYAYWRHGALTAAEIRALAKGVCPFLVRPLTISGWWPMWGTVPAAGPEPDLTRPPYHAALAQTATPKAAQHVAGSPMAL